MHFGLYCPPKNGIHHYEYELFFADSKKEKQTVKMDHVRIITETKDKPINRYIYVDGKLQRKELVSCYNDHIYF